MAHLPNLPVVPGVFLALITLAAPLSAQPLDLDSLLGFSPEAVYRDLGAPAEITALPLDATRWQAVHYYQQFVTLSWFTNRVWQVRLDKRYAQEFSGLRMGLSLFEATQKLGPPQRTSDEGATPAWAAWQLPYRQFARVLRLVFEQDRLVEATYSRGDL